MEISLLEFLEQELIIFDDSDASRPIMFVHVPAQVTRYGLVCFIDLIEMGLSNLIVFDGLLIGMDHFGQVSIPLLDLLVCGCLGKL